MNKPQNDNPPGPSAEQVHIPARVTPPQSKWQRISLGVQIGLSLTVAIGVLVYLMWSANSSPSTDDAKRPTPPEEVVQVVGPRSLRVKSGTPLDDKLQLATVETAWLTAPIVSVTGNTLASLRPGKEATQDAWQFATSDLLSAFADWQKAVTDVQFQETQLKLIRDLNQKRVAAQQKLVARMKDLVAAGTDTEKDLAAEQNNLFQFEIQEKKEVYEAETAVKLAHRLEATLARQLQQAGLEPTMLRSAAAEGDIVVAEVPERVMERVKIDMTCEVRFFALPERVFTGKVSSMSPVISKEKRVLNVQFVVNDPEKVVRPGMFADIGLGTDKREAVLMPADGVLHVGDKEYALLTTEAGMWQITQVDVGEPRGDKVEVLSGLKAGDRVLGKGAILLKPVVVRALQAPVTIPAAEKAGAERGGKIR